MFPAPGQPSPFWENRVDALRRRVNVAFWLEHVSPVLFFVVSAFAAVLYAMRRTGGNVLPVMLLCAGVVALAALVVFTRVRGHFFNRSDARVLLEAALRLDTRLTAASDGLVAWPEKKPDAPEVLQWRLRTPLIWLGSAALLLVLGLTLPLVGVVTDHRSGGVPTALLEVETMLSELENLKVAEPTALAELKERLNELMNRPPEEQFQHSNLEAADALRDQTAAAATDLAKGLDAAAGALRAANQGASMQDAASRLSRASSGLKGGALPANSRLMKGIPGTAADLGAMTAEQREGLAQDLSEASDGVGDATGNAPGSGDGKPGAGEGSGVGKGAGQGSGQGEGTGAGSGNGGGAGQGQGGNGAGQGGPGGGGGSAPLTLAAAASDAGKGLREKLKSGSPGSATPAEQLGTALSTPNYDPTKATGPSAAGAVESAARGGDAVWVNHLTPSEQAAIRKFFQ
jgi:hypothetical protein